MPELPEVQTVVNSLRPHVLDQRIASVELRRADIVSPVGIDLALQIVGRRIVELHRRAKRIVFTLDDGQRFYIHLGMTGRLSASAAALPMAKHTHLALRLASGMQVRFVDARRFGGVFWLGEQSEDEGLGPEPLNLPWPTLAQRLGHTRRCLKSALLDQALIAGLGNIYVDEALFESGLHPLRRADRLAPAEVQRLCTSIRQVLRRALAHRGSTLRDYVDAEGGAGAFQLLHNVYGHGGDPCPRCATAIRRIVLQGRSTCFCPACQPRRAQRRPAAGPAISPAPARRR